MERSTEAKTTTTVGHTSTSRSASGRGTPVRDLSEKTQAKDAMKPSGTGGKRKKTALIVDEKSTELKSKAGRASESSSPLIAEHPLPSGETPPSSSSSDEDVATSTTKTTARAPEDVVITISTAGGSPGPEDAGSCTGASRRAQEVLAATVVQMAATFLSFGTKAWVEAITATIATTYADAPVGSPNNNLITAMLGGLWVGSIHTYTSAVANGALNTMLANPTRSPAGLETEGAKHGVEAITVTGPVYAAFCAFYAARGALAEGVSNLWGLALSKTLASVFAGGLQGAMTDMLRQWGVLGYKFNATPPKNTTAENYKAQMKNLSKDVNARKLCHDYMGKVIGAVVGNVANVYLNPKEFGPVAESMTEADWATTGRTGAEAGAAGMGIFLTGWFLGIHGGAAIGRLHDWLFHDEAPPDVTTPSTAVDIQKLLEDNNPDGNSSDEDDIPSRGAGGAIKQIPSSQDVDVDLPDDPNPDIARIDGFINEVIKENFPPGNNSSVYTAAVREARRELLIKVLEFARRTSDLSIINRRVAGDLLDDAVKFGLGFDTLTLTDDDLIADIKALREQVFPSSAYRPQDIPSFSQLAKRVITAARTNQPELNESSSSDAASDS